ALSEPLTPKQWRKTLEQFDLWNERIMLAYCAAFGLPPSLLDIGCGTAAMVKLARRLSIDAIGIDLIENEEPDIVHDLSAPINLGRTFGLVMSIEVAEHIPAKKIGVFLNNITGHVQKGGQLVFTAAHPGQGGDNHINLRSANYWRNELYDRGMNFRLDLTNRLQLAWMNMPMPMYWLVSNVQVFEH
ncbi:hypothetical protein LCGC14_2853320, partial [marine sediment metagenome]